VRQLVLQPGTPFSRAKAALVALMQNISSAAAAISMVNLMARSFQGFAEVLPAQSGFHHSSNGAAAPTVEIGPVLA
jgi:hypothetical protein